MPDLPPPPDTPSPIGVMTGERRGVLLDAILENPESVEARQVYADQLIANNDPRGEYILVEIALDGPLSIRKREQLVARRKELVEKHAATWWPYTAGTWRTHRGFLTAVSGSWEQIEAIAPQLFASEPVTELQLRSLSSAQLDSLLEAPWFPRIRRLVLRMIDDDGFAKLSENAPELRALNVMGTGLTGDALAMMGDGFPRLTNLALTGNDEIADEGLANLGTWKHAGRVETLYLSRCEVSEDGLERLFANALLAKLVRLTLSHNQIGDEGAGVLARCAPRMPAIEELELVNCALSSKGAETLLDAFPGLRRLDVRRNGVGRIADRRVRI